MTHLTVTYSRIHDAIRLVARQHGLEPFVVRMLLALRDSDGRASTADLEADLRVGDGGSGIRRSLSTLHRLGLAEGEAECGGPPRRGQRTHLRLKPEGALIARKVVDLYCAEEG